MRSDTLLPFPEQWAGLCAIEEHVFLKLNPTTLFKHRLKFLLTPDTDPDNQALLRPKPIFPPNLPLPTPSYTLGPSSSLHLHHTCWSLPPLLFPHHTLWSLLPPPPTPLYAPVPGSSPPIICSGPLFLPRFPLSLLRYPSDHASFLSLQQQAFLLTPFLSHLRPE